MLPSLEVGDLGFIRSIAFDWRWKRQRDALTVPLFIVLVDVDAKLRPQLNGIIYRWLGSY
jgi:hypothetical protein